MDTPPVKSKLTHYLSLVVGSVLLLTTTGTLIINARISQIQLENLISQRADTIAHGIEYATENLVDSQQSAIVQRIIQNYATLPEILQIELLDPKGKILASSPNDSQSQAFWQPIRQQLATQFTQASQQGKELNILPTKTSHPLFIKIVPLSSVLFGNQEHFGLIIVVVNLEPIQQQSTHFLIANASLSIAGIVLALGVAYGAIRQRFLIPLQQLQSAIQNQVQSEIIELPTLREDEIGFLGQTLQQKWLELATLTQTLEQKVSDRTEEWRQSQDFLQSLLDYLPVALFVKDANVDHFGEIVLWNPKSEQLFGLTNQEVIGKTVFDLNSLEQAKLFDQADRECVASKTLINIAEETIDSYLNGRIYLHTIKVPLLNQQGEPEYLLCISEDITARKIAEDNLFALNQELEVRIEERTSALQSSENRYRALLEGASDALLIANLAGKILEVNQKAIELFGYDRQTFTNLHFSQLHPPQESERTQRQFIDIISQGQGQLLDTLICHQQGYTIPVDITGSVVEYEDQRIVIGSFRDITEQKQAIAERNRFLYIIEASFNEIYIFDVARLQLQFVNLGAVRNLGYSKETLLKMSFFNLAPSFDQASFSELLMPLGQHQQNHLVYETEHQRADQTCYPVEIHLQRIDYRHDQLFLAIGKDISDRKKAEQEIQKALEQERELAQLKSQFIDVASHEFRTPLTIILSAAEFLLKYNAKLTKERKTHYLHQVYNAGIRMKDMIEDVLVLSRLDAGKVQLHCTQFDLREFCSMLIEEIYTQFQESHSINFIFNSSLQARTETNVFLLSDNVYLDRRILHHVLSNLLSNAVKYSPLCADIDFKVDLDEQQIRFQVSDRGIGIPAEDIPYIFDSFHRANNVGNISGTGLGLHIVQRYVAIHGGTVSLSSEVDQGSIFTVIIPYLPPPSLTAASEPELSKGDRDQIG